MFFFLFGDEGRDWETSSSARLHTDKILRKEAESLIVQWSPFITIK